VILSVGITLAFLSVPGSVLLVNYMEVGWIRAYHLLVSIYLSLELVLLSAASSLPALGA
jgi:putative effector of murein hydrolase LrgA (UPF0299 family)